MVLAANALFAGCTVLVAVLAGCGGPAPAPGPAGPAESAVPPPLTGPGASATVGGSPARSPATGPAARSSASAGWTATVYYTAVLTYHAGPAETVTGCPVLDCTHGHSDLG